MILHVSYRLTFNCNCLEGGLNDIHDDAPLTPNHLLILGGNRFFPCGVFSDTDVYCKQWGHVQHMVIVFWKRWIVEYLPILQSRLKWRRTLENVKVGDLVLICRRERPARELANRSGDRCHGWTRWVGQKREKAF